MECIDSAATTLFGALDEGGRNPRSKDEMAHWHPVTSPIQTATATLHTNRGDIKIALFGNHAPKTVANFVGLAQGTKDYSTENASGGTEGPFYDGAVFHRVIGGFMLQGGDPTGTGRGGPGYKFADEFHPELVFDKPYLLAMANAGPGTNGSQFFITVGKTPHLNRKHTIFGEVVDPESQKVVDAIGSTADGRPGPPDASRSSSTRSPFPNLRPMRPAGPARGAYSLPRPSATGVAGVGQRVQNVEGVGAQIPPGEDEQPVVGGGVDLEQPNLAPDSAELGDADLREVLGLRAPALLNQPRTTRPVVGDCQLGRARHDIVANASRPTAATPARTRPGTSVTTVTAAISHHETEDAASRDAAGRGTPLSLLHRVFAPSMRV